MKTTLAAATDTYDCCMTDSRNFDATGAQLLGHMRWANQQLLHKLATLPDAALQKHANFDDWTVARIAHHLVGVSNRLHARMNEAPMPQELDVPEKASDMLDFAQHCLTSDTAIIELASQPDRLCTFDLFGEQQTQLRSILIAQAVHHAQEHRVQIAGILASNDYNMINLDELSLWYYNKVLQ
ncbi:MAG: hypothetical protein RIS43_967 [Actinomycetota bacterium]